MKALKFGTLAAALMAGFFSLHGQTVDEIMNKHFKAIGGREAWENIRSMKAEGSLAVQGIDVGITQTLIPGKAMRRDVNVMGMNGFTIVTPKKGWNYLPFQPGMDKMDTMKADVLKMEQAELELKSKQMFYYKTDGTKAEYTGMDTLNKVLCYRIRFTDKDGSETTYFFDTKTYLIIRSETKVKKEDQEQEIAMGYDNYKSMDGGVMMPMSITSPQGDITFKSIELNKPVDESIFTPAEPVTEKESTPKK